MTDTSPDSILVLRSEMNNIRKQIRSLKFEHQKDVEKIRDEIKRSLISAEKPSSECLLTSSVSRSTTSLKKATHKSSKLSDLSLFSFPPIGFVQSCHHNKNGSPRQPSVSPESRGTIDLSCMANHFNNPQFALENMDEFSHIWIIFVFHQNQEGFSKTKVAPPRLDGKRVGIFSTRSPHRPNPIGLTLAKIESIEGSRLNVSGLDLISGTPVLDIKPFISRYDNPKENEILNLETTSSLVLVKNASWIEEKPDLKVVFTQRAEEMVARYNTELLVHLKDSNSLRKAIVDILSGDPRSSYRRKKCLDKLYYFDVDTVHVTTWFDNEDGVEIAEVLKVEPRLVDLKAT